MQNKRNIGTYKKRLLSLLMTPLLCISACSSNVSSSQVSEDTKDILTLKKSNGERTKITVLVKYAFTIHKFEKIIEEKFPDIDIVQVGNFTANTLLSKEMETRLKNDDLTDVVMTWPYDVGEQYWKDRLLDLSGMPFTSKYNTSMLDSIVSDSGALYYLPGPADIRGIIYNKTMFMENGWSVPSNYEEFIALCKQIEASGNRAFLLPLGNAEVLDTAFVGFNYGTAYGKPMDAKWLAEYDEGRGNFMEHFSESIATFQNLIDEGIIKQEDLNLTYAQTQSNLFNRKTVMTEDSVLLARIAKKEGNSNDDYALMPFYSRIPDNDWSRIYMTCFIGLNKHLQDRGNETKYKKVMKLMNYISTPEGQKALASDNGAMFSSLRNMDAPDAVEIHDLRKSLSQGRYGVFPTLKRSEGALRYGLKGMILGTTTAQQLADMVDRQNKIDSMKADTSMIAKATKDFTYIDTGNLISDYLKKEAKSDFAFFLDNGKDGQYNGKGVSAKFYKGDITDDDIDRVFPDFKHNEKGILQIVEMTGKNVLKALEYTVPIDNKTDWFYYFSGLKLEFNPMEQQGSRVSNVTTSNGQEIDKNKMYTVAILDGSIDEKYISSVKDTTIVVKELLRKSLKEDGVITPSDDHRFTIVSN